MNNGEGWTPPLEKKTEKQKTKPKMRLHIKNFSRFSEDTTKHRYLLGRWKSGIFVIILMMWKINTKLIQYKNYWIFSYPKRKRLKTILWKIFSFNFSTGYFETNFFFHFLKPESRPNFGSAVFSCLPCLLFLPCPEAAWRQPDICTRFPPLFSCFIPYTDTFQSFGTLVKGKKKKPPTRNITDSSWRAVGITLIEERRKYFQQFQYFFSCSRSNLCLPRKWWDLQ